LSRRTLLHGGSKLNTAAIILFYSNIKHHKGEIYKRFLWPADTSTPKIRSEKFLKVFRFADYSADFQGTFGNIAVCVPHLSYLGFARKMFHGIGL
jgi:hypothetical protein